MSKQYALHPGNVCSQSDGDLHYITPSKLIHLYKVNPRECFVWNDESSKGRDFDNYVHLYPDYLGEYTLPEGINGTKR